MCDAPEVKRAGDAQGGLVGVGGVDIVSAAVEAAAEPTIEKRAVTASHVDWATLLHRVWGVDVLACPRCGGRMRFIATITDRAVIRRILERLGLPAGEVTTARARSWEWDDTS